MIAITGCVINLVYTLLGRSSELVTFYDYPKIYQDMVMRQVTKQAGEKQRAVVAEFKRNSK